MRQPGSLPMSLPWAFFFFFWGRNTQFFSPNKVKNGIITTNSVTASQTASTDRKQKQTSCQHKTQNNRLNYFLSSSTQLLLLRKLLGKVFRCYPQRWQFFCVSQSYTQCTTPKAFCKESLGNGMDASGALYLVSLRPLSLFPPSPSSLVKQQNGVWVKIIRHLADVIYIGKLGELVKSCVEKANECLNNSMQLFVVLQGWWILILFEKIQEGQ